jgi:hypothetical protein
MVATGAKRRGHGEDTIYFAAAKNRYVGAVSLGFGPDGRRIRRKVYGRTKQEVRDKLKTLHAELDRGLRTSGRYTVRQAVEDWLRDGLPGRSERTRGVNREATAPLLELIGSKPLILQPDFVILRCGDARNACRIAACPAWKTAGDGH